MLLLLAILAAVFLLPSPWNYVAVIVAAAVELAEVKVFLWYSRRRGATTGAEALVGEEGRVVAACRPVGQIRVVGELWRARCEDGAGPGDRVVVDELGPDLTLLVHRVSP
ncbi:MAG TPA: NfeD family protein [Gaiellaceae bacterium]|jgi:membrane protein implicated in regulation of membrane protease activity|nr:NfeD family protein [Gaiellaceae bacterium]